MKSILLCVHQTLVRNRTILASWSHLELCQDAKARHNGNAMFTATVATDACWLEPQECSTDSVLEANTIVSSATWLHATHPLHLQNGILGKTTNASRYNQPLNRFLLLPPVICIGMDVAFSWTASKSSLMSYQFLESSQPEIAKNQWFIFSSQSGFLSFLEKFSPLCGLGFALATILPLSRLAFFCLSLDSVSFPLSVPFSSLAVPTLAHNPGNQQVQLACTNTYKPLLCYCYQFTTASVESCVILLVTGRSYWSQCIV